MPTLAILIDEDRRQIDVPAGANLRRVLLDTGISPYAPFMRKANCGGRGLCATCGVRILENAPTPSHWHDRIGHRFGYPRLSCQVTVQGDMTVRILTDKIIWGRREST
jgi:ferredoxin